MSRVFKPWTPSAAELELLHECWLARLPPARIAARLCISALIRRITHSFAAHLPQFSYNIQHVMLIQLRRLWRTRRVNRMARYSGSISTAG